MKTILTTDIDYGKGINAGKNMLLPISGLSRNFSGKKRWLRRQEKTEGVPWNNEQ